MLSIRRKVEEALVSYLVGLNQQHRFLPEDLEIVAAHRTEARPGARLVVSGGALAPAHVDHALLPFIYQIEVRIALILNANDYEQKVHDQAADFLLLALLDEEALKKSLNPPAAPRKVQEFRAHRFTFAGSREAREGDALIEILEFNCQCGAGDS